MGRQIKCAVCCIHNSVLNAAAANKTATFIFAINIKQANVIKTNIDKIKVRIPKAVAKLL